MMKTEAEVLDFLKPDLDQGERAEFEFGTLFLKCAEKTSRKVFSNLFMAFNGKVQIHRVGTEFAIDFV